MAAIEPTSILQLGPGASGYNSVTANGKWTNGATLPGGTYFCIDTVTLPKVVMVINLTATQTPGDGWCSATMLDPSAVYWETGLYDNEGIWLDWRWVPVIGDYLLKNGVNQITAGVDELDEFTGFDLPEGDSVIGAGSETLLYFTLGSISSIDQLPDDDIPGYHYWVGHWGGIT